MKAKKIGIGVFLALALVTVFSVNANAALGWYKCTIEQIGSSTEGSTIQIAVLLKDTKGTFTKWFVIPEDQHKAVLAIMLTGITNDMTVNVYVDPSITDWRQSPVKYIYLLR